ncbi:hypothetical protein [Pontibacter pamirensis]|uniref:hypothetical protein n=1 Tax=Pontibacter pamirensis TaxID=2562824 RepID=UPI001F42866C|nr:hypothetical protein [Pontibacter pamirensis]
MMMKDMKLSDIPKRNVHQVPEKYFDRLPMQIMERTAAREQVTAARSTPWWQPVRYAIAPLILLLLFVGVYFFSMQQEQQVLPVNIASLTNDEIMNYLNTYAQVETADFEEYSVADQELTAEFLNVSATTAEEELEYYRINDIDY